jgi:hypothetical protein
MRFLTIFVFALALASPAASAADGAVRVAYVQPEKFTDASLYGGYGEKARAPALDGLRLHLERLGQRYLQPDQVLTIEVSDLDLAGRFEPWRALSYDVRYLTDITWPRMTLRYTLSQGAREIAQGEERISDMAYLMTANVRVGSDSLRYEKKMLDDWFRARFVRSVSRRD